LSRLRGSGRDTGKVSSVWDGLISRKSQLAASLYNPRAILTPTHYLSSTISRLALLRGDSESVEQLRSAYIKGKCLGISTSMSLGSDPASSQGFKEHRRQSNSPVVGFTPLMLWPRSARAACGRRGCSSIHSRYRDCSLASEVSLYGKRGAGYCWCHDGSMRGGDLLLVLRRRPGFSGRAPPIPYLAHKFPCGPPGRSANDTWWSGEFLLFGSSHFGRLDVATLGRILSRRHYCIRLYCEFRASCSRSPAPTMDICVGHNWTDGNIFILLLVGLDDFVHCAPSLPQRCTALSQSAVLTFRVTDPLLSLLTPYPGTAMYYLFL
jgi:hypothetical protein